MKMLQNVSVAHVLLSSPSDLPPTDKEALLKTFRRWNSLRSDKELIRFELIDWEANVTPGFAKYPQERINEKAVLPSDAEIVIFTDKLGSPTKGGYESGTIEEIVQMRNMDKPVAILRNLEKREPLQGAALREKLRMDICLDKLQKKALTKSYKDESELSDIVFAILTDWARDFHHSNLDTTAANDGREDSKEANKTSNTSNLELGIWAHVETTDEPTADSRGRLKVKKKHVLVLKSTLPYSATQVKYKFVKQDGSPADFDLALGERGSDPVTIPPNQSLEYQIFTAWQSDNQANCVVSWLDNYGQQHSNMNTVRL